MSSDDAKELPRVFVNSIPKSGTNLLEKLIREIGLSRSGRAIAFSTIEGPYAPLRRWLRGSSRDDAIPVALETSKTASKAWLVRYLHGVRDGQYVSGHAPYSESLHRLLHQQRLRTVQIFRDPRAVLVSWARYSVDPALRWYPYQAFLKSLSLEDRIRFFMAGGEVPGLPRYQPYGVVLERAAGWLDRPDVMMVRYEDLVGSRGGGSDDAQLEAISAIAEFLGRQIAEDRRRQIQETLYGNTHTFRKGRIDGYRDEIDTALAESIMEACDSALMTRLGYVD